MLRSVSLFKEHKLQIKYRLLVLAAALLLCFISSCRTPYLYDKIGFEPGNRPKNFDNPNAPSRIAPDYYYRQPAHNQQPYYAQQPQATAPYSAPPSYQNNNAQPPSYQRRSQNGGSRSYSNPYAIPPSARYPNYDADQYYVPPTYYNNIEPQIQLHKELLPESNR